LQRSTDAGHEVEEAASHALSVEAILTSVNHELRQWIAPQLQTNNITSRSAATIIIALAWTDIAS